MARTKKTQENKQDNTQERSKYNVSQDDLDARTCDGIVFDSKLEMRFYRDVVLPQMRSGELKRYELQKRYTLQPAFTSGGKKIRPIEYISDFYLEYADGHAEVIDTKGCPDQKSKIKQKMFLYHYPDLTLKWMGYVKKYGGWLEYDEIHHKRLEDKKLKKKLKEEKENEP